MGKHILQMYLAPDLNDDNKVIGYIITDDESQAVFSITYSAESWREKDENEVWHDYTDFNIKEMEILGFSNVFQFVRVATGLERHLSPFIRAHYYNAIVTGEISD